MCSVLSSGVTHPVQRPGAAHAISATATDTNGTYTATVANSTPAVTALNLTVANVAPTIVSVATVQPFAQEGSPVTLEGVCVRSRQ